MPCGWCSNQHHALQGVPCLLQTLWRKARLRRPDMEQEQDAPSGSTTHQAVYELQLAWLLCHPEAVSPLR